MRKLALALAVASMLPAAAIAAPPQAAVCAGCHGPAGVSPNPEWPNIAGQNKGYLVSSLKGFRDGTRNNPMMSPVAKGLSDGDIETLATYFSGLSGK